MAVKSPDDLAVARIPEDDTRVASGEDLTSVGRNGDAEHASLVALELAEHAAGFHVPDADGAVFSVLPGIGSATC